MQQLTGGCSIQDKVVTTVKLAYMVHAGSLELVLVRIGQNWSAFKTTHTPAVSYGKHTKERKPGKCQGEAREVPGKFFLSWETTFMVC